MLDVEDRKEHIEMVVYAAAEVWNEIEDPDTRRGAALLVGKLLFPDEDGDIQVWLAETIVRGAEEGW